jgi:hypothetical protein
VKYVGRHWDRGDETRAQQRERLQGTFKGWLLLPADAQQGFRRPVSPKPVAADEDDEEDDDEEVAVSDASHTGSSQRTLIVSALPLQKRDVHAASRESSSSQRSLSQQNTPPAQKYETTPAPADSAIQQSQQGSQLVVSGDQLAEPLQNQPLVVSQSPQTSSALVESEEDGDTQEPTTEPESNATDLVSAEPQLELTSSLSPASATHVSVPPSASASETVAAVPPAVDGAGKKKKKK